MATRPPEPGILMFTVHARLLTWAIAALFFIPPGISAQSRSPIRLLQIEGMRRPLELETRAGEPLDPARIERDVRRLWLTGWFEDIQVELSEDEGGAAVKFVVRESPRLFLREVKFEPPGQRRPVALAPGTPIDKVVAAQIAGELRRQFVEEGFPDAAVRADLVPAGFRKADLVFRVEPGRAVRVADVRISGAPGLSPKELRKALKTTRVRRILPGLGPLWGGWKKRAPFSERAMQDDADRLRSLYLSKGFFDVSVRADVAEIGAGKASVTFHVDSGPRYRAREIRVVKHDAGTLADSVLLEGFSTRDLCGCLLAARRESELRGEMGFAAQLEIVPVANPTGEPPLRPPAEMSEVSLRARWWSGAEHRVGRIEFRGHRALSEATLRRALVLEEGAFFDSARLRRSLGRLNRLAGIEPVELANVLVRPDEREKLVHLTFRIQEKPRGRWAFSGPLGPLDLLAPMQFLIASRLPGVGGGAFELSTYYASFSLLAFASPWPGVFPAAAGLRWFPLITFQRPYLPGQAWQSGVLLSPQLGARGTSAVYAMTQANERLREALGLGVPREPDLVVPVSWSHASKPRAPSGAAGFLRCEPKRGVWVRWAGAGVHVAEAAAGWVLTGGVR
jgi:outer membrane protein insertion porin family